MNQNCAKLDAPILNTFRDTSRQRASDPGRAGPVTTAVHTEKSFRNIIESNRNQIVFTIIR